MLYLIARVHQNGCVDTIPFLREHRSESMDLELGKRMHINWECADGPREMVLDKEEVHIFYMNMDGKTIDTLMWQPNN